jgi:streptomycin 6-kinase
MGSETDMFPSTLPVIATVSAHEGGPQWLAGLPSLVDELRERWSLRLGPPIHGGSCSWVAPAWLPDGESAVLKVTWPHREAAGEGEGLRLWDGRGAVRVLRQAPEDYAVLIERCEPGDALGNAGHIDVRERLLIGARLLSELWSATPPRDTGLERVAALTADWADTAQERMARLRPDFDPGLVATAVRLLRELPGCAAREVLVHGDFNPGNVLSARRRPWLAIDAKPMIGDPGYDPWPFLAQVDDPFSHPNPRRVLAERFALFADAVGEAVWRLAAWAFAREVESALWAVDHADSPIAHGSMDKAYVFAELAEL